MAELSDQRAEFIEKIGQIAQGEGMPKIAGRLFGLLMFDGEPVAFGELAVELQVSRGSISSSARLLEDRGVIKRVGVPGKRQDFFQIADHPFAGLLEGAQKRSERAALDIEATVDALPQDAETVRARLGAYGQFYRTLNAGLQHALENSPSTTGPKNER